VKIAEKKELSPMPTVVMIRHGQSEWNLENLFAGWVDIDLTPRGIQEAVAAGDLLKSQGFVFDLAYTSYLRRANKTLEVILDRMDLLWITEKKTWRLNERHYGSLQGLNRVETLARFGEEQFKLWRRSYSGSPPPLAADSPMAPFKDPRYSTVPAGELPLSESLQDCTARILPYWSVEIVPRILGDRRS
jgi:2,3-bisphosphoglycerate-dependent phosphoglycerate mutase